MLQAPCENGMIRQLFLDNFFTLSAKLILVQAVQMCKKNMNVVLSIKLLKFSDETILRGMHFKPTYLYVLLHFSSKVDDDFGFLSSNRTGFLLANLSPNSL